MSAPEVVDLRDGLARIDAHWEPRIAAEECSVLLFEPASTLNTGDAPRSARTRDRLGRV